MRTAIHFTAVFAALFATAALAQQSKGVQPRSEHPRPDFRRDDWLNLNGVWQFSFDPEDRGLDRKWQESADGSDFDRKITVPFCWESPLSGIGRDSKELFRKDPSARNIGWYRHVVTVPKGFAGKRIWLRFGAVDWDSRVWVNGKLLGRHQGGYSPFEFDVTDLAAPGEEIRIVVRVEDPTDPEQVLGKQVTRWYTPTSGIWQTVWLEARPALHVVNLRTTPRYIGGIWSLDVEVDVADDKKPASKKTLDQKTSSDRSIDIEFKSPDGAFPNSVVRATMSGGKGRVWTTLEIPQPKTWSPTDPHLYDLDVLLGSDDSKSTDTVHTYFGLRTIERKNRDASAAGMILLNGSPVYLRGVLDQSFNPQGICTAPSDDFMQRDMKIARDLGCNFIRIHIKSEEPRRLYWADRMGLLLMADMPCTFEHTARARTEWEKTMRATIGRDRNHPSIIAWCLFNESWGLGRQGFKSDKRAQDWVLRMWTLVKDKLDPSRLVEDNSPCLGDHVKTDINSWHFYIDDHEQSGQAIETMVRGTYPGSPMNYVAGRKQGGEPLIASEYGAVGARDGDRDISWGFRFLTTQLRRHAAIQGYAYTELTDIEWEHNGLVNYDRSAKEFGYGAFVPGMRVADLQGADFIGFDAPPVYEVAPEETFTVPVFVSHFSTLRCDPCLRWRIVGTDNLGQTVETPPRERPVVWQPYDVTFQKPLRVTVPTARPFVGALTLELLDDKGRRLGANYLNLIVRPISTKVLPNGEVSSVTSSPRVEVLGPNRVALRFDVDDFSSFNSQRPVKHWLDRRGKFIGLGKCNVSYRISLPVFVREAIPAQLTLMTELATKSVDERLDWPATRGRLDCPQTEERKHPGRVAVSLIGEQLWRLDLPDDPADSRGVLSHQNRIEHGSFGYLVRKKTDLTRQHALRKKLCNDPSFEIMLRAVSNPDTEDGTKEQAAGISLFGERTGRYPIDPTIIIDTARQLSNAPGWTSTERVSVDRLLDHAKAIDVIKTAEQGGHEWRLTTDAPAPNWAAPHGSKTAPDDAKWTEGSSGFGRPVKARIRVATLWETPQIWLRTQVQLPTEPMQIVLRYCHSGDTEIFVNGKSLVKLTGSTPGYCELTLDKEQMKLFRKGPNTVAVHCRNGSGRQALDLGLRCVVVER
ncbi:MAG: hypothetical protein JXM70_26730 [Pirellulales bacterium]|nr:hypothetical protein [Pirellulales bacterium]